MKQSSQLKQSIYHNEVACDLEVHYGCLQFSSLLIYNVLSCGLCRHNQIMSEALTEHHHFQLWNCPTC